MISKLPALGGPVLALVFGASTSHLLAESDQLLLGLSLGLLACPPLTLAVNAWHARRSG